MPRIVRGLMLALTAAVVFAAPASAHTDIVSSDPADGQTLKKAPAEVSLRFGEDLIDGGQKLVATDAAGDRLPLDATISGPTISAPWPAEQSAGTYNVSYRVVAADGHPLEGKIRFTIKEQPAATAQPVQPSPVADTAPESGSTGINVVAPLLLGAALAAAGFFVWRSRAD